jgi:hypothetical protein
MVVLPLEVLAFSIGEKELRGECGRSRGSSSWMVFSFPTYSTAGDCALGLRVPAGLRRRKIDQICLYGDISWGDFTGPQKYF